MPARDWNRHTILAELRSRGMTLEGLAEEFSLSLSGVKHVWNRPNERVERAMAKFLDVRVEELFPKRYPKRGNRIYRPVTPKQPAKALDAPKAA